MKERPLIEKCPDCSGENTPWCHVCGGLGFIEWKELGTLEELIAQQEAEDIKDHCKQNGITSHLINADGSCNMGCC